MHCFLRVPILRYLSVLWSCCLLMYCSVYLVVMVGWLMLVLAFLLVCLPACLLLDLRSACPPERRLLCFSFFARLVKFRGWT